MINWVGGPAIVIAVNVIGWSPVTVAVAVSVPTSVPTVQSDVATPSALVDEVEGLSEPDAVVHVTTTPDRRWP
jgi:hypothetical protein